MLNFFQVFLPKRFIGIDIGTSYIKIAEISRFGHRRKLENYGSLSSAALYQKPFRTFEKNTLLLSNNDIARALKAIIEESKIKSRQAIFSIPDFSTFFTTFELPQMTSSELPQAVNYEARQHIPFPLGEMTIDWRIIENIPSQDKGKIKILLAAVSNEAINQYRAIAQITGLELYALEAEIFSLMRSSREEAGPVALMDIGARSTTCGIVDKENLYSSHSFSMSGDDFINALSKGLTVDFKKADELKEKYGILANGDETSLNVKDILMPLIDVVLREAELIFNNFYQKEKREIRRLILAGGNALIPGLKEYFSERLKVETVVADPFSGLFYPPILEAELKKMGPAYSVCVGSALRGLDY